MVKSTIEEVKTLIVSLRDELTEELSEVKDEIKDNSAVLKKFDTKFTKVLKKIDEVHNTAVNAKTTADDALQTCKRNEESIATINEALVEMNEKYDKQEMDNSKYLVRIRVLEKQLEDQINRSCRKTIVVRGVKESEHETWDDTRSILAAKIATVAHMHKDDASDMIERVHRSRPTKHKTGKRDIIAGV